MIEERQITDLEELECIYCDMHKDAYGVKARWYRAKSIVEAYKDIDSLQVIITAQMAQDKIFKQEAITAFEELVKTCPDRETAKRWQHQAYETGDDDELLAYRLGLPYGYFKS